MDSINDVIRRISCHLYKKLKSKKNNNICFCLNKTLFSSLILVTCSIKYIFFYLLFCSTLVDGELGGYFIPKGSYILNNLWAIHHDRDYWGKDADEFRPERFLTDDGKAVKKWDHLMPFSIGKLLKKLLAISFNQETPESNHD